MRVKPGPPGKDRMTRSLHIEDANSAIWQHGNMSIWKYGNMAIWSHHIEVDNLDGASKMGAVPIASVSAFPESETTEID